MSMDKAKTRPDVAPINENIRADRVQLITAEGENRGLVPFRQALDAARQVGLDLVLIAERGNEGFPVTKIMDYGKEQYAKKKQTKPQKVIQIKEIKLRPKIGDHDYVTKIQQAIAFLQEGKRVKFTLMFKGREVMTREERGTELFTKITESLDEAGLAKRLVQDKDLKAPNMWSRMVYLKS